jgi:DNA-binding IclR family transcriptional regulator
MSAAPGREMPSATEAGVVDLKANQTGTRAARPGYGPIAKTIQLLELLADAPPEAVGVRAIARKLGLPVSSVHRLLGVLVSAGMVEWDAETHQYSIGVAFYRIAALVTQNVKRPRLALPALRRLAAEFNETALLGLYLEQQGQMIFAERVDGTEPLQYQIALLTPLPLIWGASGKSILAFLDPTVIDAVRRAARPAPTDGRAPPDRPRLKAELEEIRRRGFVVSEGEKLPGARGVAAPVFGPAGVVGCICITSPADRLPQVNVGFLAKRIVAEANYLSNVYGGEPLSEIPDPGEEWPGGTGADLHP